MTQLILRFVNQASPELVHTRFEHPILGGAQEAVRGNTGGALALGNTFKWTNAVRALSVLLLRTLAQASTVRDPFTLSGIQGSLASSLDYAISKEPNWLIDMFGLDVHGNSLARRIFNRTNPERKRPGPVLISLNPRMVTPNELAFFVDNEPCCDAPTCNVLADRIEAQQPQCDSTVLKCSPLRTHSGKPRPLVAAAPLAEVQSINPIEIRSRYSDASSWEEQLRSLFRHEILRMLRSTDIFNSPQLRKSLSILRDNLAFTGIVPRSQPLISPIDEELKYGQRLGMSSELATASTRFPELRSLRVAVPPALVGSIAIFRSLQLRRDWPRDFAFEFCHSLELVSQITNGQIGFVPDMLVLGLAQGGRFLTLAPKLDYLPLMVMPKISQRIVAPKGDGRLRQSINCGHYLFMTDEPSDAGIYFSQLRQLGVIKSRSIQTSNVEPFEASALLAQEDPNLRAILWFPHYDLNTVFNRCRSIDPTDDRGCLPDNLHLTEFSNSISFLFVHRRLFSHPCLPRLIDIAIRDAWMTLKEGGEHLDVVVDSLVQDRRYTSFLRRCSGLEELEVPTGHHRDAIHQTRRRTQDSRR